MEFDFLPLTASLDENSSRVLMMYTGGTIGMEQDTTTGYLVPFSFERMLSRLPDLLDMGITLDLLVAKQPIDSSNVSPADWITLAQTIKQYYEQYHAFVVLHGTDTMAYTASAMSYLLEGLSKPIVFTGAQLPISLRRSDGKENLMTALEIAIAREHNKPILQEVALYFGGKLIRGNRSKKVESNLFDAFQSENYPLLAEAGAQINFNKSALLRSGHTEFKVYDKLDTSIALLKIYPGINERQCRSLFEDSLYKAVLMETYGAGNTPTSLWFSACLQGYIKEGGIVLNVSQCPGGRVIQGKYATSKHLLDLGVVSGNDMTTESALSKLMFVLANSESKMKAIQMLGENLRGELSSFYPEKSFA
jgi:L-asparaginase